MSGATCHVHVERSTTDKLEETLNDAWTSAADDTVIAVDKQWVGGRDWVVTVTHRDHTPKESAGSYVPQIIWGAGGTGSNSTVSWTSGWQTSNAPWSTLGLKGGVYENTVGVEPDGAVVKHPYLGWVEDTDKTWIMYLDRESRPAALWLKRAEDGGVIGQSVVGTERERAAQKPDEDPWMEIKKRNTAVWGEVRPGCVVEEHGNAWVLQSVSPVQELGRGVGRYGFTKCVAVQMILANGGNQPVFVVRGSHESVLQICELTEADLKRVMRGDTAKVRAEDYA